MTVKKYGWSLCVGQNGKQLTTSQQERRRKPQEEKLKVIMTLKSKESTRLMLSMISYLPAA
jgi:hypothetical protein